MRRKEKHFRFIEFRGMRWRVPNVEWRDYVRRGLVELVSSRVAQLRAGVEIVFEGGRHLLRDLARSMEVSIPSSWRLVERAALFDVSGPRLSPEALQREIQSDYCSILPAWEVA